MRIKLQYLFLAVLLVIISSGDAFARRGGGFGGGFKSSSSKSSWSSSKSSSSKSKSSWSSSKSTSTSNRPSSTSKMSAADKAALSKAKSSGTVYKTKDAAKQDFLSKNSSKYTSKYDTKPSTRPSHIPQATTVNGKSYNINYDTRHGGYGYYGPSGSWIAYDIARDATMLSLLMSRNNYVVHDPYNYNQASTTSMFTIIGFVIFFGFVSIIVIAVIASIIQQNE